MQTPQTNAKDYINLLIIQKIKNFEINFEFTPTKISNVELFACKIDLKTVFIIFFVVRIIL